MQCGTPSTQAQPQQLSMGSTQLYQAPKGLWAAQAGEHKDKKSAAPSLRRLSSLR